MIFGAVLRDANGERPTDKYYNMGERDVKKKMLLLFSPTDAEKSLLFA